MTFFQNFLRKSNTSIAKKPITPTDHSSTSSVTSSRNSTTQPTNYENLNIGLSFLKHADTNGNSPQNILSVLWVGCLPYVFPDEEIPVCLVLTTVNVFLFRVFHPSDDDGDGEKHDSMLLDTMTSLEEAMHCFYSFPLSSLRQVVVGLFDQGIRLEVGEEGPRGTFVLLTRDANKTARFLDTLTSVVTVKTGKQEVDGPRVSDESGSDGGVNIVYPDESKINALKAQLQEQHISPLDGRENLISYCIVYQIRENKSRKDEYDDVCSMYLRSLILTNMRIFLCDEDYVHWPLPSYIHSAPFTSQWIVDDVNNAESVIGVDSWEEQTQNLRGNYGLSLTFEGSVQATSLTQESSGTHIWNILFQSLSEREQLVRSLASIWKNSFGQDLKVTRTNRSSNNTEKSSLATAKKGHAKKPSGNMVIPSHQSVDSPQMFTSIDRARLNELFRNKIAQGDDVTVTGVQYVTCVGCQPYKYPNMEFPVAVVLGKYNIYLISAAKDRKYLLANTHFEDQGSSTSLYLTTVPISDLQQVVVGLFDQCLRLETGFAEATFVLVTRDFDRTNDLIQRLSQAILALPKIVNVLEDDASEDVSRKTAAEIFHLYKKEEDEESRFYPKSEFIHPNSSIKFVYPSDELLGKLRIKIQEFIQIMNLFPSENDFGILLYALISQTQEDVESPCTIVISEKFVCLIHEDHVSYPLPLFVKELPETLQYDVYDARLISSLIRVEYSDFHSGELTLVFNARAVDPSEYNDRFKMGSIESDVCYVTDVNAPPPVLTVAEQENSAAEENVIKWKLKAYSYAERERIFDILSKMWANLFGSDNNEGKSLPVTRAKN